MADDKENADPSGAGAEKAKGGSVDVGIYVHNVRDAVSGLGRNLLVVARIAAVLGLWVVMLARGCDSVGQRRVVAAQARARVVRAEFENRWEQQHAAIEREITALRERIGEIQAMAELTDGLRNEREAKQKAVDEAQKRRDDLRRRQNEERRRVEATWRTLDFRAQNAQAYQQLRGPGRERMFLLGSLVLVLGLLGVASQAKGVEKWVALVVLVVVVMGYFNAALFLGARP